MHTPGPWTLTKRQGKLYVLTNPDSQPFVGQIIATETTAPETKANLRLIAAAPALLEALELLVKNCGGVPWSIGGPDLHDAYNKAEAAIAAARGEGVTA